MLRMNSYGRVTTPLIALSLSLVSAAAQPSRINRPVDHNQRVVLSGHLHPRAQSQYDQGRVSPSMMLSHLTLNLSQSESQKADLDRLLSEQQDPASPNYHRWLTPDEYAQRFGVSEADLNAITAWLQQQGLTIISVARGRNWIAFDGSAAQIEAAFQTELRQYTSDGETHFANSVEPSVPKAFAGVISGIHGLNDFRLKPAHRTPRVVPTALSVSDTAHPNYNSSKGTHYLAPDDLATIYNIRPLFDAGFDGSGQKLVIGGQTQINLADYQQFRTNFNLPANDPQIVLVPNSKDPGTRKNDVPEANLDLEWSGAVARNAKLIYVYTNDVMQAVQYAIDQNLAPVVSTSYGLCEAETPRSQAATMQSWARQGNAQGITWFSASGDSGGADCNDSSNTGLSVDIPASIPEVTGVGGTQLSEGTGQYWNAANDANRASVSSYIPETSWNDSVANGQPSASGGGASIFFAKPSWQNGAGIPNDNTRHVPDVAMAASPEHDGYLTYTGGNLEIFGGTSVPTPVFAGLAALLNQYAVANGIQSSAGLGNINPNLYTLAQTRPDAFHDVTSGDNIVTVTCSARARNCSATPVGFSAGTGYDEVTGLGSVDAYKLFTAWTGGPVSAVRPASNTLHLVANSTNLAAIDILFLTASVTGANGITPSGSVTFSNAGVILNSVPLAGSGGTATATLSVLASQLSQGARSISAQYSGDTAASAS